MASMISRWIDFDYEKMCSLLATGENFSFSRFGDGEWAAVTGISGQNCDGHSYDFPDLRLALAAALLSDQRYYMGLQPFAVDRMGDQIDAWCRDHNVNIEWCNSDLLHNASIDGRLDEFGKALAGRRVILVAPKRLAKIAYRFRAPQVEVPLTNAWKWKTTITGDILDQVEKDCVIIYCAGMTANAIIDHMYRDYGDTITQIDAGSVFEPYLGIAIRKYHHKIIERIKEDQ